jgi:hypothetical protein
MVDVPVLDNSVPDGVGAVGPTYTNQPPKQLLTTVPQAKCLLALDAARTMVDVPVVREYTVPDMAGAICNGFRKIPPKKLITPVRAPIKPRFIATNHFKVRLAKKFSV